MLTKIRLRNFQRHRELDIKITSGVTVLVGSTDAGKSSVIRGLGFVLLNRPSSHRLMTRRQQKPAEVDLYFGKKLVTRIRGKKLNVYALNGKVYKAFGRDKVPLPPDVAKFVNVTEGNFQRQIDGPLWFTCTPGELSKRLNKIVDLQVIDGSLARAASACREAAVRVKVCRENCQSSKKLVEKLQDVPGVVAEFRELERLKADFDFKASSFAQVAFSTSEAEKLRRNWKNASYAILEGKKAVLAGAEYARLRGEAEELRELVSELESIEQLSSIEVPDVESLSRLRAKCDRAAEDRRELEMAVEEATQVRSELCQLRKKLVRAAEAEARSRPKTCPTCGQFLPSRPTGTSAPQPHRHGQKKTG